MNKRSKRPRRQHSAESSGPRPPAPSTTQTGHSDRGVTVLIAVALLAGTFALYIPSLSSDFVDYDDPQYVTANPVVQQGLTPRTVRWAFTTGHFANWLPVTWLSHLADVSLFGLDPRGHHATSGLLHAVNAALLFLVVRGMTGARVRSVVVALLFAVHPVRVESVSWIAERKDVLAGTFFLLTLLAYARYMRRPGAGRYAVVCVAYALGLMSKTMLVTLPFLLLLLDWWPLRRLRLRGVSAEAADDDAPSPENARHPKKAGQVRMFDDRVQPTPLTRSAAWLLMEKVPLLALAAISAGWTVLLQESGGALRGGETLTLGQRMANAVVSIPRYLGKTVWPADLSPFYIHPGNWPWWAVAGSLAIVLAITVLVLRAPARRPYLAVGWLWFLGMLVPVLGIIQAGIAAMADRYHYLPGIGLLVAVVWGAAALGQRWPAVRRLLPAATAVAATLLALCTWVQQTYWRTTLDLFERALHTDPNHYVAHDMIGMVLSANGDEAQAIAHYRRAIELNPAFPHAQLHLAMSLESLGRTDEAIAAYREAVLLDPAWVIARVRLGAALSAARRFAEADQEFAAAARAAPNDVDMIRAWAVSLADRGDRSRATALARKLLTLAPNDPVATSIVNGTYQPTTAPATQAAPGARGLQAPAGAAPG